MRGLWKNAYVLKVLATTTTYYLRPLAGRDAAALFQLIGHERVSDFEQRHKPRARQKQGQQRNCHPNSRNAKENLLSCRHGRARVIAGRGYGSAVEHWHASCAGHAMREIQCVLAIVAPLTR